MTGITKQLVIDAIKGCSPSYEMMEHPFCKANGRWNASYGEWKWNHWSVDATLFPLEVLIQLYNDLKSK